MDDALYTGNLVSCSICRSAPCHEWGQDGGCWCLVGPLQGAAGAGWSTEPVPARGAAACMHLTPHLPPETRCTYDGAHHSAHHYLHRPPRRMRVKAYEEMRHTFYVTDAQGHLPHKAAVRRVCEQAGGHYIHMQGLASQEYPAGSAIDRPSLAHAHPLVRRWC
jgi:hypothetical protein